MCERELTPIFDGKLHGVEDSCGVAVSHSENSLIGFSHVSKGHSVVLDRRSPAVFSNA